jgi:ABC-type transport system involved in multi-copper enzyme maturation permease subunit
MRPIVVVARFTFLEGVRARFFLGTFFLSLFLVVLGSFTASIPYGKTDEVMARIGWGAVFLLGFLLSTFYAVQHISKERDQRVLHLLLSKPIHRTGYALGKFLGLYALTVCGIFTSGLVLYLALLYFGQEPHTLREWLLPSLSISLKCGVLLCTALTAVVLFGPFLSLLIAMTVYLAGVGTEDLLRMALRSESPLLKLIASLLRYAVPQFPWVDIEGWVIFKKSFPLELYLHLLGYLGGYLVIFLATYLLAFSLREIKE